MWTEVHRTIYTCYVQVDAPPTKQQCNREADLLTMSEYRINKHLTGVQAQATGYCQCESTIAWYILLGSKYKRRGTTGVKYKRLMHFTGNTL